MTEDNVHNMPVYKGGRLRSVSRRCPKKSNVRLALLEKPHPSQGKQRDA
eukprot:CAMPEP_0181384556 /NCGR_PEP_ID=MMETSP1106-20121128/22035_1 /TAXON_ID=81844 /ORGANISM="Mantoniella antarctica, Strain SL-175" /LENGTH=48 /DNA_ID= /DNA_START= /DNA_END= /DNA_ORIENTATION=